MGFQVVQHALGAVGRDITEPLVIVPAMLPAQLAESIEEITGEETYSDSEFEREDSLFEPSVSLGGLQAREEYLRRLRGERSIIVDHVWNFAADERLAA